MNDGASRNANYYDLDDILIEEEVNVLAFMSLMVSSSTLKLLNDFSYSLLFALSLSLLCSISQLME